MTLPSPHRKLGYSLAAGLAALAVAAPVATAVPLADAQAQGTPQTASAEVDPGPPAGSAVPPSGPFTDLPRGTTGTDSVRGAVAPSGPVADLPRGTTGADSTCAYAEWMPCAIYESPFGPADAPSSGPAASAPAQPAPVEQPQVAEPGNDWRNVAIGLSAALALLLAGMVAILGVGLVARRHRRVQPL